MCDGDAHRIPDAGTSAAGPLTDCFQTPSRCGYPDATTTGASTPASGRRVPDYLTRGAGWFWDPRGWLQVTGDGTVVEGLLIGGPIEITAAHVVVRDCVIRAYGDVWAIGLRHANYTTIDRNTIGPDAGQPRLGVGIKDVYSDAIGTTISGNDISRVGTGIQMTAGVIRDNFIHDLDMMAGDHVNGITSNGGSRSLVIENNTVLNWFDQTDAIGLFQDFGVEADRLITGNLLAGGGYTIYGGDNQRFGRTHDIRIIGNRFSRTYFEQGGLHGPSTSFDPSGKGNVWADNVWDDDGTSVG